MDSLKIELRDRPFDPFYELAEFRKTFPNLGDCGASSIFVGTMREYNDGDRVLEMYLEHYAGMTEEQLNNIVDLVGQSYKLSKGLLLHRVGTVYPGEDIVLVAAWCTHRKDAFSASREIMEALKSRAPFWKKEMLTDSNRWVEKHTPGE